MTTNLGTFREYEIEEGEHVEGIVARLPETGIAYGSRLFLTVEPGGVLALNATAKHGCSVLERELERASVSVGDRVRITYHGWRKTADDLGRRYRHFTVEVLSQASGIQECDGEHDFGPPEPWTANSGPMAGMEWLTRSCTRCNAGTIYPADAARREDGLALFLAQLEWAGCRPERVDG